MEQRPLMGTPWATVGVGRPMQSPDAVLERKKRSKSIDFDDSINLPSDWGCSEEILNHSKDILSVCGCRINGCWVLAFVMGVGICWWYPYLSNPMA